jgi:hypothetical protein
MFWQISDGRPEAHAALARMNTIPFYEMLAAARRHLKTA